MFGRAITLGVPPGSIAGLASASTTPSAPTSTIYVDGGTTMPTAQQNGSLLLPYKTIQQAITFVPAATTLTEMQRIWLIDVANGWYDEDLAIVCTNRKMRFQFHGVVGLGTFEGVGGAASGTRRNITITGDGATNFGTVGCLLAFVADQSIDLVGSILNAFYVSGKVDGTAVTNWAGFNYWAFLGVRIYGTDGTTAGDSLLGPAALGATNIPSLLMNGCFVQGKVTGNFRVAVLVGVTASAAWSVRAMSGSFSLVGFAGNITINSGGLSASSLGFVACTFGGITITATATAQTIAMDSASYASWLSNASNALSGCTIVPTNVPSYPYTLTAAATTGNQTINKPTGSVRVAATGTTVTVTNSYCAATSRVLALCTTADTTCRVTNTVASAGSFVINCVAATAETEIFWMVINQ